MIAAALLLAAATWIATGGRWADTRGRRSAPLERLRVGPAGDRGRPSREEARWDQVLDGRGAVVAAAGAGAAVVVLSPSVGGLVLGVVVSSVLLVWLRRLEPRRDRERRARVRADLPIAMDLVAACLLAGAETVESLAATAGAVGGPLGESLAEVAARLRLGETPVAAFAAVDEPALAPLADALVRAIDSGAPLATTLAQSADQARERERTSARQAARAVGVRAAAPLGLCFLPAFVLVGVVPTVVSLARSLLG